jgi:hypothetical protein
MRYNLIYILSLIFLIMNFFLLMRTRKYKFKLIEMLNFVKDQGDGKINENLKIYSALHF